MMTKPDDADNIDCALGYLQKAREHARELIQHTSGSDNMAATRLMELIEQTADVLERGY